MKTFSVQMLDRSVSSDWWRKLIERFVRAGDPFEIRCWKEETSEIAAAARYGTPAEDRNEVSVKGTVTPALLDELLTEEPADKELYNKMTKYFTLHAGNGSCEIWSAHYGTELYLYLASDDDAAFFEQVMAGYPGDFSIGRHDGRL